MGDWKDITRGELPENMAKEERVIRVLRSEMRERRS